MPMARPKLFLMLSCLAIVLSPVKSQNYQCSVCPVGTYKSTTKNEACVPCPKDTYQSVLGATSPTQCNPCPANSYSSAGSSSLAACGCAAGYSGDVGNYSLGVYTNDLTRACTSTCATASSANAYFATNAIDGNAATASLSSKVVPGDPQFVGMKPWWKVTFEREAVVQSVVIRNEATLRQIMSNFYIRVGNDNAPENMNTLTACAGPLTWTGGSATTMNTYACTAAVRGRYLYIINGDNAEAVVLTEVYVRGYLAPATDACSICPGGSYKVASGTGTCTPCAAGLKSADQGSTSAATCTSCPANTFSGAGAAQCVACPDFTTSWAESQSIDMCKCNAGYTPQAPTVTCNAFQALYLAKRPWADYRATEFSANSMQLIDKSGNGRNSQENNFGISQVPSNGGSQKLTSIKGDVQSKLFFPEDSIPPQFTICSVTRYTTSLNRRTILTAAGHEWFHGHSSNKFGVAYYGSRDIYNAQIVLIKPRTYNTAFSSVSNDASEWLVMCSKNGGSTPLNILANGAAIGTSTRSDADPAEWVGTTMDRATRLCINCRSAEESDWELSNLLIWASHLNDTEMNTVSSALLQQVQTSVPLNSVCTQTPSNTCNACVAGKYKSGPGQDGCVDCASGKYQPDTGAAGANKCLSCPANTDAPVSSPLLTSCKCLAGYSGSSDGTACAVCPVGSYKTSNGTGQCTACGANMFSTIVAQTTSTCTRCPANSSSPVGSDEATDCVCDAGYTGANGAACLPCVTGTYKTAPGSQVCTLCGNNTYSSAVAATLANTCANCQANSMSVMGSDDYTDCKCLAGYLTNDLGFVNATCSVCVAGTYNPKLGATTCSKCAGGFKSSSPGAVAVEQCLACPVDTYSAPGAAQCDTCPGNTFAPAPSVLLTDCKCLAGYYATNGQDGSTCQACPAGTFKPLPGAAACTQCPVNRYSTMTAATSNSTCLPCTDNAVSPVSSSASSMCECDRGYYGSGGVSVCNACIAGTFKDTLGSAACTNCTADTYSDKIAARNASVCTACYNNAITAAGSDSILDCGCSSGYEWHAN